MPNSVFGWSYPPGCSGPPEYPEGCEVCLSSVDDCECPECSICGEQGNPECYEKHGLDRSLEQKISKVKYELQELLAIQDMEQWKDEDGEIVRDENKVTGHEEKISELQEELWRLEAEQTDPYGHLSYCVGSEDDFWCFDYGIKSNGDVILHSVVNSETGGFIEDGERVIVSPEEAVDYAIGMLDSAYEWCFENDVKWDHEGWNQPEDITKHKFVTDLKGDLA
jgi:hypothetical protein